MDISIHAPREGGDAETVMPPLVDILFQSTPPARGATEGATQDDLVEVRISIHAPREGGDHVCIVILPLRVISIHAPREGGDMRHSKSTASTLIFQSTPPARGATYMSYVNSFNSKPFQSTPPARGATASLARSAHSIGIFQSTPPARGATQRHQP